MSDDLSIPHDDPRSEQQPLVPTTLVAIPDDPDEPREVTIRSEDASEDTLATEWIALAPEDLVALRDRR